MKSRQVLRSRFLGVGLVEVLITLIVIGGGLLAVGRMQGGLMSSSADLKAQSEAIRLAEAKLEEMRLNATLARDCSRAVVPGDYAGLSSSTEEEILNGVNATFTRSWTLTAATSPDRHDVAVTVGWANNSGDEQATTLETIISLNDLCTTSSLATDSEKNQNMAPSPNNVSSVISNLKFDSDDITTTSLDDGSGLRQFVDEATGDIYLLKDITEDDNGNDLQGLIKLQGGVLLSVRGTVFMGSVGGGNTPDITLTPTADYPVAFSDLAYCVFPLPNTTADYICYFGGDCANGGTGCPDPDDEFDYLAVNGGWYGKVGLIETDTADFQNRKVCFSEDISGTGIETAVTTARFYRTSIVDADREVVDTEGINQSFNCHNFLIVEKRGSSYPCEFFADYTIPSTSDKLAIPSSSISRFLDEAQTNSVRPEDASHCSTTEGSPTERYIITGVVTGAARDQVRIFIGSDINDNDVNDEAAGSCVIIIDNDDDEELSNDTYTYYCTLETNANAAVITALYGGVTPATRAINLSSSQLAGGEFATGDDVFTSECPLPWGGTIASGGSVSAFENRTVTAPDECVSETRECAAGLLSGSFEYENCTVMPDTTSCHVVVTGNIYTGEENGAKSPGNPNVVVNASPVGSCIKVDAGETYSYDCSVGVVANGSTVSISGTKVVVGTESPVSNPVTVVCPVDEDEATLIGPDLYTLK